MPKIRVNMAEANKTDAYEAVIVAADVIDNVISDMLPGGVELVAVKFNYETDLMTIEYRQTRISNVIHLKHEIYVN